MKLTGTKLSLGIDTDLMAYGKPLYTSSKDNASAYTWNGTNFVKASRQTVYGDVEFEYCLRAYTVEHKEESVNADDMKQIESPETGDKNLIPVWLCLLLSAAGTMVVVRTVSIWCAPKSRKN